MSEPADDANTPKTYDHSHAELITYDNTLDLCCRSAFEFIIQFHHGEYDKLNVDVLQEVAIKTIQRLDRRGKEKRITHADIDHVRYALAALIDETIMTSTWHDREAWKARPLQLQYFGEHLAGEGFYHRLQQLMEKKTENKSVLMIYWLCLEMGFKGKYREGDHEQLPKLKHALVECLELDFSLQNESVSTVSDNLKKKPPTNKVLFVAAGCLLGLTLLVHLAIGVKSRINANIIAEKIHSLSIALLNSNEANLNWASSGAKLEKRYVGEANTRMFLVS